jgi:hypothetical protein
MAHVKLSMDVFVVFMKSSFVELGSFFTFCFVSRIAPYVTRMRGGVGGALSDGRPYPDS